MSGKVQRSDKREQEYDRYAESLLSSDRSRSIADMFGSGRSVSYQQSDARLLPTMTSGLLNLSEMDGPRKADPAPRPKFRLASDLGDEMSHEMVRRAMNRRVMAGLPMPEMSQLMDDDRFVEDTGPDPVSADEILASIDAILPTIARRASGQMNRTAQKTAIDLVKMMGLPEDQTDWFVARIEGGVTSPEVFRRDLKMAFSSEEVL
jgi:hypothetical protein